MWLILQGRYFYPEHSCNRLGGEEIVINNYLNPLNKEQLDIINGLSLDILQTVGVEFRYLEAIEVLKKKGCKVDGSRVLFFRNQIEQALETAPSEFTIFAREQSKNCKIGGDNIIFIPGYGAPFVSDMNRGRRKATMEDYTALVKLAYMSKNMDVTGGVLVEPNDIPDEARHLEIIGGKNTKEKDE